MDFRNTQRITGLEFENYLQIDRHSHSSLKQMKNGLKQEFKTTPKVELGKAVDAILTCGEIPISPSDERLDAAFQISDKILESFGPLIKKFKTQVSFMSDIHSCGLELKVKGRLDWLLEKYAVIDLKVNNSCKTVKDCIALIEYMGYKRQLYLYRKMANVPDAYIILWSTKANKAFLLKLDDGDSEQWWEEKIIEYGTI